MLKITVTDVHSALNGTYELDDDSFTNRELHIVKQVIGAPVPNLDPRDPDLSVAFAVLALRRAGKITSPTPWACDETNALWDAQLGQISAAEEDGREPDPPMPVADDDVKTKPAANGNTTSDSPLANDPSPTGAPI